MPPISTKWTIFSHLNSLNQGHKKRPWHMMLEIPKAFTCTLKYLDLLSASMLTIPPFLYFAPKKYVCVCVWWGGEGQKHSLTSNTFQRRVNMPRLLRPCICFIKQFKQNYSFFISTNFDLNSETRHKSWCKDKRIHSHLPECRFRRTFESTFPNLKY